MLLGIGSTPCETVVAQGVVVYPEPNNVPLSVEETRPIAVPLDDVENISGVHVELKFDLGRVQIIDPTTQAPAGGYLFPK